MRRWNPFAGSCHGDAWISDFYDGFDNAVAEYNDVYFNPRQGKIG